MPEDLNVRSIEASQTHDLRERVLRPGHPEDVDFPGDADTLTVHGGAFDATGRLLAIASMYHEARPGHAEDTTAWRLRGMAAEPDARRRGAGRAVLDHCIAHARSHGATLAWCNARTPAVPFYEAQGWRVLGDEFEIPGAGPHFVMERPLTS